MIQSMFQKIPFITQTNHDDWKLFRKIKDIHFSDRFTLIFKQSYNGVSTFSGEILVHLQIKNFKLYLLSVNLKIIPDLDKLDFSVIDNDHSNDIELVKKIALQFIKTTEGISETTTSVNFVEKVIYRKNSQNYLCWWMEVESFDKFSKFHIFIDVHSGEVIEFYSVIRNAINREVKLWVSNFYYYYYHHRKNPPINSS